MTDAQGKVAFITGGGSGVGYGQASVFADAGCRVAIADVRQDHLDEAADRVERELGPVQLLFNTAGVNPREGIEHRSFAYFL
ncbi:MAG: SDR family NAD(P)-dependent oxidoreductase [Gammaproteobacteria bacterium]|nr:SDR family NAD(P)-dependent oxidoreductase [Gammaproteobacteria bacterium]